MAILTISSLITDQFISALCNTLVHSLWQGILLAAVTGFIIVLTRKASAAVRYNLLITALALFAVGAGVTFFSQFKIERAGAEAIQLAPVVQINHVITITHGTATNEATGFKGMVVGYLNSHHNTIVLIWFLIICAKSIQLVIGLWGVKRLKHTQTMANNYWTERIQQLANNLAIKQSIQLFESALAKVPMVIGNLKPVILMPIGLLAALTTAEIEAILVHELAHIKRRDYLINLLQSLMEIVFFFNPAVLWVSQMIKTERENCCDDLALTQSGSTVNYIRALVSCEEYQAAVPAYAMAFPGAKNQLIDRVKRIAGNRNHSLNLFEKASLALCLVASGVFFTAFTEKEHIRKVADKIAAVINNIETQTNNDGDKNEEALLTAKKPANKVINIGKKDNSVSTKLVNSLKLVPTDMSLSDTGDLSIDNSAHLKLLSAYLPPLGIQLATLHNPNNIRLNSLGDSSAHLFRYDAKTNQWYDHKKTNGNADTVKKANLKTNVQTHLSLRQNIKTDVKIKSDSSVRYYNTYRANYNSKVNLYKADSLNRMVALSHIKVKLNLPNIADLLYDAGLIKDKANFSAFINNDELIVNGETQPENVHQIILKKYQKKPDDKVNFSFTYGNPSGRIVPIK